MDRQHVMPPFAYYGGKTTLAEQIAELLPPHEHYVEPFAGSLAVLLCKKPSRAETVNDLDGDLMAFWRVLRDRPEDLERVCALTPHSRAELSLAADLDVPDELERARRVFVRLTQSRSHSMKQTGWWTTKNPLARVVVPSIHAFMARIEGCAARLANVSLESRDALDVIRDYGAEPNVCLYVDPPYLGSTRATNYRVEMLADDAHQELADALSACTASVVLSGYDSPLYADLFHGWHVTRIKGPTALSGESGRVEVLWSNRVLGEPDLFTATEESA